MDKLKRQPRFLLYFVCTISYSFYGPVTLAQAPCPANSNLKSVVTQKHSEPPALSLLFAATDQGQCKSNVTADISDRPSWELIDRGFYGVASVDNAHIIFDLAPISERDLPKAVILEAQKAGIR